MHEQRRGDIRATLALSYTEALNGTTRTLTLPTGRQVTVSLPAGAYNGQEIRLENQGEVPPGGGPPGALILTLAVVSAQYPGVSPYTPGGQEFEGPTEFVAPPPSPTPVPTLPDYAAGSGGAYTNYAPQGVVIDPYSTPPAYTPAPQYAPPPQRRGLAPGVIILLIVVVVLLIGGGGLIYYVSVLQPAQLHAQATATAQAQAQATTQAIQARVNATASAIAQANANVTATATAFQNIYTQATSGTAVLSDPMSGQDKNNWDEGTFCVFSGGTYHAKDSTTGNFATCNAQNTNFANLAYQAQMTIISGDYGGILFRSDSQANNAYYFDVYRDGRYTVEVEKNNTLLKTLADASSPAIKTGLNQTNTLAIVAQGSSLYFYINGQFVTSASDTTFGSGQIGVIGGDDSNAADVAYSNLKVWQA